MWYNRTISLILPTFKEKNSIRKCIRDFKRFGIVDEIVVVDNNAQIGTREQVEKTGARIVYEPVQGYGSAIRRGLSEAKGYYLIVCEPDGTFEAHDIYKFLGYARDADFVVGTRTTQTLILEGANMGFFLKWGNYFLAKTVEFLFNTVSLTDVGCTYRLIRRRSWRKIADTCFSDGNNFGLEMILLIIRHKISFIQIPVNYKKRVGKSSVTGNKLTALLLGLQMILLIVSQRFSDGEESAS